MVKKVVLSLVALCFIATTANAASTVGQNTKNILKKNVEATKTDLRNEAKKQTTPVTQAPAERKKQLVAKQKEENKSYDSQIKAKQKEAKKLRREDPVKNAVKIRRLENEADALTIKKDAKSKFYQRQIDAIK